MAGDENQSFSQPRKPTLSLTSEMERELPITGPDSTVSHKYHWILHICADEQ